MRPGRSKPFEWSVSWRSEVEMQQIKICEKCGRQFFPGRFTPYQKYCKVCKGKTSRVAKKVMIPDDVIGMYTIGGKTGIFCNRLYHHIGGERYWCYGKGFYRKLNNLMVMKNGKEVGYLSDVKKVLKKVLKGEMDEKVLVEK